jgi:hypothetical protein
VNPKINLLLDVRPGVYFLSWEDLEPNLEGSEFNFSKEAKHFFKSVWDCKWLLPLTLLPPFFTSNGRPPSNIILVYKRNLDSVPEFQNRNLNSGSEFQNSRIPEFQNRNSRIPGVQNSRNGIPETEFQNSGILSQDSSPSGKFIRANPSSRLAFSFFLLYSFLYFTLPLLLTRLDSKKSEDLDFYLEIQKHPFLENNSEIGLQKLQKLNSEEGYTKTSLGPLSGIITRGQYLSHHF